MIINLSNDLTKQQANQITYLASGITAGGSVLPVKNPAGFNANWAVQIGQTGEEGAEIVNPNSIGGTSFTIGTNSSHSAGTFLFSHAQDTPLYQIHYDQFILYRSTSGTSGPFSSIATVSITPDSLFTQYDDTTGVAGGAYYAQYYNSLNGDLSGSSSIFQPGGPTYYSLQKIRQRIKDKLYSAGFIRDDTIITDWINEAYEQLVNAAIKVNQGYLLGTAQYGFGTAGYGTITDSLFKQAVKMEVTYDGASYIPSTEVALRSFTESDFFNAYAPRHAWIGETVFEILPHNTPGTVKVTYATRFTPLVNDTDELTQTLKAYTTAFVEYGLAQAYGLDQKSEYDKHMQVYELNKANFIAEITPRDQTGAKMIDIGESVSGLEDDLSSDMGDYIW